jgi:DNA-binding XRE family transcriptional regulator
MAKRKDFVSALDRISTLPRERREKIESGAAKIIEEMHLAEIRKAMKVTQVAAAKAAGLRQSEISRIEHAPETVQMRTLERYAESLGGEMMVVLNFPDGWQARVPMRHGKPVQSKVSVAPARGRAKA